MPQALAPASAPLAPGTRVHLADGVRRYGERLLAGGAPWRLVRLSEAVSGAAREWQSGSRMRADQAQLVRTLVDYGILEVEFPLSFPASQVDVVVPVFNATHLDELLGSLTGLHVTVVDDASREPEHVARVAGAHGARLVRLEANRGPGGARNAGLAATSRPLVWFLDADVRLEEPTDVLDRLARHFADPMIAAVAPRVVGTEGSGSKRHFERGSSPLDQGERSSLVRPGSRVAYVPGACLLTRREALGDGFRESLRVGEDVDLVWGLSDRGWLVRYDARVRVHHEPRASWSAWLAQRVDYGTSAAALARRHGSRLAPLRLDVGTLQVLALALSGRGPAALATIARLHRDVVGQLGPDGEHANAILKHGLSANVAATARSLQRHFPYVLALGLLGRRTRRLSLSVLVLALVERWRARRPSPSDVALGLADDVAYSFGLLRGAITHRTLVHLRPEVRGRARASSGVEAKDTADVLS